MCARNAPRCVFLQSLSLPTVRIYFPQGPILHPLREITHLGIPK